MTATCWWPLLHWQDVEGTRTLGQLKLELAVLQDGLMPRASQHLAVGLELLDLL
ncbi:hypothetical protein [Streptomyces sp. PAM3C]|uniref:hypothetical protein n=1 Tax=unclassified Streptomyces TaxID=2593676 RepID=UPI001C1DF54A|nr:hypothetical protein [Streptomyces sp. PAM3C]MBU5946701.1 hypothetical protein [Streptomyces sp. PAM3C]